MASILFDRRDHELVEMINAYLGRDDAADRGERHALVPVLHPNGLYELGTRKALRVAWAVMVLLEITETSTAAARLEALKALQAEALSSASSPMRLNTARVLIQLMKELLRARGDVAEQLRLAHDFNKAASGRPRITRPLLRRYNLLEMPEEWNQRSFDYHVHDSTSSGRKSPTHLIMDAWLKGIRTIKVIYDNYVPPAAAEELTSAAEIMGVAVRVGIRFYRHFRGQRVTLVWTPRGFSGPAAFAEFLARPAMQSLLAEGHKIDACQQERFAGLIDIYNADYRLRLNERFGLDVPELAWPEFETVVAQGQPSWAHLADCIHRRTVAAMRAHWDEVTRQVQEATGEDRERERDRLLAMERFSPVTVVDDWLSGAFAATEPLLRDAIDTLANEDPPTLLARLAAIGSDSRTSIDSRDLTPSQVLQLLYLSEGRITHLELFKLRTYRPEQLDQLKAMNELRETVNSGNPARFKRLVTRFIEETPAEAEEDRACLQDLLHSMPTILSRYGTRALSTFVGSDSSGRTDWGNQFGMGFVLVETLPMREQAACYRNGDRRPLPIRYGLSETVERGINRAISMRARFARLGTLSLIVFWWFRLLGLMRPGKREWSAPLDNLKIVAEGNVLPLGGSGTFAGNKLDSEAVVVNARPDFHWRYANTVLVNVCFILAGFIPAFLAFQTTQHGGFLAIWGAPLWFTVTGIRNILQAVISGGGLRRYSNLTWKDYVSWTRLSESLFYTGFSVPLLELGVRFLLLQKGLGLTAADHPVIVFLMIACVNGCYIMSHNLYRGLPTGAAYANLGRNLAAVPVALLYNFLLLSILRFFDVANIELIITATTTLVSKTASDTAAAVIEGHFDRQTTLRLRLRDFHDVLSRLLDCQASLELSFPQSASVELLRRPAELLESERAEVRRLAEEISIHCLDLMYFHFYQPLAAQTLRRCAERMSKDERRFLLAAQDLLQHEDYICQLFLNGVFGRRFSPALAFYLSWHETYRRALPRLLGVADVAKAEAAEATAAATIERGPR
jgi:hypothetical protein